MSGKSEKKEHQKKIIGLSRKGLILTVIAAVAVGASITIGLNRVYMQSSTDESCQSCHVHPQADKSWKLSSHHNSKSGVVTGCAECHLPPKGSFKHFTAKARTGLKDLWAYWTKDSSEFDWESKKELDHAVTIVYNESCKECHQQLFPSRLSQEGITAHLYYEENEKKLDLQCISCHLDVGHYDPNYTHAKMQGIPQPEAKKGEPFTEAATVTAFENFTETIPGTTVSFDMKAIPGGTFAMGSPDDEPFRRDDEGPVKKVTVSPFFIGETEVTWDQYWAFYAETMSEGRTPPEKVYANNSNPEVDAISGPTPPFGIPDQGQRQPAGHHDDPLRGRNVLPVVVEKNRQEIPSADRSRMGIRDARRNGNALLLRRRSEETLRSGLLAEILRCRHKPLRRLYQKQQEQNPGAVVRTSQPVRA